MKKRICLVLTLLICIIFMYNSISLANVKTKIQIVRPSADTLYLDNKQGYLDKKITLVNNNTGEINISLSLYNNMSVEENTRYENTEIFIMIPLALTDERKQEYISYIETFANKVFAENDKTKIGIIGIKGTIDDGHLNEEGNMVWGENDERTVLGRANDSEIVVPLTKQTDDLSNGVQTMNPQGTKYYMNIQAALRLAKNSYSENVNKILISLYDNVPKIAIGVKAEVTYGGIFSEFDTMEEAVIDKHEKIVSYTKKEMLSLADDNIEFILLRPDDTSFDQKWYKVDTGELELEFDGSPYVQELYGTIENPTYGKMYSLNDANLETIVTEYVYKDVMEEIGTTINSVVIKDYFPKEILDNFEISFTENTELDVSTLENEGYVTWNIGKLDAGQSKTIEYTIKLKNMNNSELLNKDIPVSEKVEIGYVDYTDTERNKTSNSSPIIRITQESSSSNDNNNNDNQNSDDNSNSPNGNTQDDTTAPGKIPQTGANTIVISIIGIISLVTIIGYIKIKKMKDIK